MDKHEDINTGDIQDFSSTTSTTSSTIVSDEESIAHKLASIDLSRSRYLPQTQAVITTQDDWKITTANQAAHQLFKRDFNNYHVLDLIDSSQHCMLIDQIVKTREEDKSSALISGYPVLIIQDSSNNKASAILWLKEKKSIFIWTFEPVYQSTVKLKIDKQKKTILDVEDSVVDLFDYSASELIQRSINTIIPQFDSSSTLFTGCSQLGATFPVIVNKEEQTDDLRLRITSMPTLTGTIQVNYEGQIEKCQDLTFVKYLFGTTHVLSKPLSDFIPQFSTLLHCLKRDDMLIQGCILNSHICRSLLSHSPLQTTVNRRPSMTTPTGKPLPILVALHRDGTFLEIDLQVQITSRTLLIWIAFDRQAVLYRYGHKPVVLSSSFEPKMVVNQRSQSINIPTLYHCHDQLPHNKGTIDEYEIVDDLGQGAYGIVKLAYLKKDTEKKKVAIKYVYKSRVLVDCWTRDQNLGLVPAEIHVLNTLKKIPHVNCSGMLDYFEDQEHYYVIMDLFGAGMDLFDYIEYKKDGLSETEVKSIFRQIMEAVCHLHQNQIVHRDIKDENVILDLKGGVRLIDFGSATYMTGKQYDTFVGTLDYAAPEILRGQSYTGPPQDIWACGALLYTLIYRENPFYNMEEIMERELRLPFILSQESVDLIEIEHIFDQRQLSEQDFLPVTRYCQLPDYLNLTLYRKIAQEKDQICIKDFRTEWKKLYHVNKVNLLFNLIKKSGCLYISPEDFMSILEAVVVRHPGLKFLSNNTMFQERYNQDHDLSITKKDLFHYNGGTLSERIIHQIMQFGKVPAFPRSVNKDVLTYLDFIWLFMSEIDKSKPVSIEYWFRCLDEDGDGIITCYDLQQHWQEQERR
ncbi:hypothetical protein G6F56_001532 [Rhizopus delemar]|nr:hypothetical protein G6F56_001532 [Rhizopus delemar]